MAKRRGDRECGSLGRSLPQEEEYDGQRARQQRHDDGEAQRERDQGRGGDGKRRHDLDPVRKAAPASESCRTSSYLEDQGEPVRLQKMTQPFFNVKEPFEHTNFDPVCCYSLSSAQSIVTKHTKQ